jgi:hypothetical protein
MRGEDMRWFDLAFLPVAVCVLVVMSCLGYVDAAYGAMYLIIPLSVVLLVRTRIRGCLKWTGLVGSTLVFGGWIASNFAGISIDIEPSEQQGYTENIVMSRGCLQFSIIDHRHFYRDEEPPQFQFEWWVDAQPLSPLWLARIKRESIRLRSIGQGRSHRTDVWHVRDPKHIQAGGAVMPVTRYILPLWIPFILVAVPTVLLWRRDRRIPPGHCRKCRYDLTGNTSGICPECGTPT